MDNIESQKGVEPPPEEKIADRTGVFADLPPKVEVLLSKLLKEEIGLGGFVESLKGVPGRDNFFKRLRRGTRVKMLRSSGVMDKEDWIIDFTPETENLRDGFLVKVHNREKHVAKFVPLVDLIRWNI